MDPKSPLFGGYHPYVVDKEKKLGFL